MKRKSRLKLALIADKAKRRQTFKKRKRGMIKKLHELVTLCDIKACAVIYSPYESSAEAWPSREGVEEVVSRFMVLPEIEQTKRMLNQEAYLRGRITTGEKQVKKLCDENRESKLREFMFECLNDTMVDNNYDAGKVRELSVFIDQYLNRINRRIEILTGENQPSSFPLPPPIGMDKNLPLDVPNRFHDQFHHRVVHGMQMNVNANLNLDQSCTLTQNSNQYPNHSLSFTELLTSNSQQMANVGEHAGIPFRYGNHHSNYQLPAADLFPTMDAFVSNVSNDLGTVGNFSSFTTIGADVEAFVSFINNDLATSGQMPSSNIVDCFIPNITNDLATTGYMSPLTTLDADGFVPNIKNDLSTISRMPSITIANSNAFTPYANGDPSTISHMPLANAANHDGFAPYMSNNI